MAWQSRHAGVQGTARSREVDRIVLPERRLYDRFRRGSAVLPQGRSRQTPVTDEAEPSSAPGADFRGSAPPPALTPFRSACLPRLSGTFSFPATFSRETSGEPPWPSNL